MRRCRRSNAIPNLTVAWLIGVARHTLVDHWRRQARGERGLRLLPEADNDVDDGAERFERTRARDTCQSDAGSI